MIKHALPRLVVAAALVGCFAGLVVQSEEWGPAKTAYDDYIKRPSLQMRTRGRIKLASTMHPGAFKILSESYAKPEQPTDQVKYLLASICANYFKDEEFDAGWTAWREKYQKPEDAWLWFRSLIMHQDNGGEPDLYKIAEENKELFLRVAALEALCENGSDNLLAWWEKKLESSEDWKDIERALMLETAAKTLYEENGALGGDQFRRTALKLIPLIEHKKTHDRTKVVMARYFRDTFGGDKLYVNAEPWLQRLLNPEKPVVDDGKYAPPTPPTKFVGIESAGKRIVYVIDFSDSMLAPMSVKEKEEIKKPAPKPSGPVTGSGEDPNKPKEDEKPAEDEKEPEEDPMPWEKIKTRFDCAREYLKLSLKTLQPEQTFCVIIFGTTHETLKCTKGLIPASKANIDKACGELDGWSKKIGGPTPDRKYGTIMGNTNLHGGIIQAFKLTGSKEVKEYEYVTPETFFTGADTVFVLSDGDPTWDDWAVNDKRDKDDQTGDPESRTKHADQDILLFPGPYGYRYQNEYLPDDVRRLNLFRKCEIHCIGIGEASQSLLYAIAQQGNGQVKMVGGS
jgi:hypothetical protein